MLSGRLMHGTGGNHTVGLGTVASYRAAGIAYRSHVGQTKYSSTDRPHFAKPSRFTHVPRV
jgi:hypothetical protein